jgi:3-oxocholest-4-en-26-oyl-CoA dehydrogenase beta subunit
MDFGISEEQRDIQNLARQILKDLVTPEKLVSYDNYAIERFDRELWGKLAEAGLLGVAVPEEFGGMGFGFMEVALLMEEIGRTIAAVPMATHMAAGMTALTRFGSAEQKQRLLPGAVAGELLLCAALDEQTALDPCEPAATARADGTGYRLSGEKFAVPFAQCADRIIVGAASDEGLVVVLLDPRAQGVTLVPMKNTSYEPQALLRMDNVLVDAADVLAGPAAGAALMRSLEEHMTIALCAHQVGVTDTLMRQTASYTSERKQFGVPIATFQAVGHRAANCFIDVECLRLTTYQAASMLASGTPAAVEVDIAKIWAGDVGHRVSYAAQHLHGGAGVDRGNSPWRYCLWARFNEMTQGSSASRLARLGVRCANGEATVD